jgi:hypothetical protein
MGKRFAKTDGLSRALLRLIREAAKPLREGRVCMATHTCVMAPIEKGMPAMLDWIIERKPTCGVLLDRTEFRRPQSSCPGRMMGLEAQPRIVQTLRDTEQLGVESAGHVEVAARAPAPPQPPRSLEPRPIITKMLG